MYVVRIAFRRIVNKVVRDYAIGDNFSGSGFSTEQLEKMGEVGAIEWRDDV